MIRYPALIFIAKVYKGLAYLVGILAAVGIIVGLNYLADQRQRGFGITLLIQSIIGGAFGMITLLAASEAIKVFIDIEENTRKTAEFVQGDGLTPANRSSASPVPTSTSRPNAHQGGVSSSAGLATSAPEIPEGYKFSADQAAQAIAVTRGTLQGYIRSGRINANPDGTIDAAELLRAGFIIRNFPPPRRLSTKASGQLFDL